MSHSPARTFNRRTFAKGVGWAAPAVVASAAVPAYAASICEVRTAPSFRQAGAWTFRNPESGVLKAPASNQPANKFGKQYWISNTTALGTTPAVIKISAGFEASAGGGAILNTACSYRVYMHVAAFETSAASGEYRGNPKLSLILRDPKGRTINGKVLRYTTDPNGVQGYTTVPLGQEIKTVEWNLKAIPGVYSFEAVYDIPAEGVEARRIQNRGLAFTPPTFEPQ